MLYLTQITLYAAVFYIIYVAILKNTLSHAWNRAYLLLCALLPLVLPFITIPVIQHSAPINKYISYMLPAITVRDYEAHVYTTFPWLQTLIVTYGAIVVALLCLLIMQYQRFRSFIKKYSSKKIAGLTVLENTGAGPGSFGNNIFLPGANDDVSIFEHEQAHIAYGHTYDIVVLRVLQCIFWPNMVLYLIMKELKMVHEFQADAVAAKDNTAYAALLLNDIFHTRRFSLPNTFFHNPVKRRIIMLQKVNKSTNFGKLKVTALSLAFLSGVVYLQSCKGNSSRTGNALPALQSATVPVKTDTAIPATSKPAVAIGNNTKHVGKKISMSGPANIYGTAEELVPKEAHRPDAGYDLNSLLNDNLHYPEYARMKNIQGRVTVKFVVDEKGHIIMPEIMSSPDTSLSREALAVVNKLPDWKPGRLANGEKTPMAFYLPIAFKLEN